jgi:DNA-binding FrmR family transcriptional regulator
MDESREILEARQNVINRLNRIEGQVKGVRKMIEEEQACGEIMMQIAAVKAAINKVGTLVFETHFRHCLDKAINEDEGTEFVDEVIKMLGKYIG